MKIYDGGIIFLLILGVGYYFLQDEIKKDINKIYYDAPQKQINYNSTNYASEGFKKSNGSDDCPTEVTEVFYSKASGEITVCKGKLLKEGQKSRVVRVNK